MAEDVYSRLLDEGYTDEQIMSILGLGALGSEEADLQRQQEQADLLRNQASPQGMNPTGRVYTAANPLEHIGNVAQVGQGQAQNRQIDQREREIWQEQMRRRAEFLKKQANKEPTSIQPAGVPGASPKQVMI